MTLPAGVMLPDELERRKIFHLLKMWSSYTAWKRIHGFYKAWVDIAEESMRLTSQLGLEDETSIKPSKWISLLKGIAQFEEGIQRLRKGDKRVFRAGISGAFHASSVPLSYWTEALRRFETDDIVLNVATPKFKEFVEAVGNLEAAWRECSPVTIEDGYFLDDAPLIYGVWLQEWLPKMVFPETLPEVPDPSASDVFVHTGRVVPCSGIWEPVDVAPPKPILSLLRTPKPTGPFARLGCMNYLHGGSRARRAKQETDTDSLRADVTWRLLWKDDRYADGTIPEEEAGYVFMQPKAAPDPARASSPSTTSRPPPLPVARSGEAAPVGGRWLVEDDLAGVVTLQAGEVLPLHQGRAVQWVLAAA